MVWVEPNLPLLFTVFRRNETEGRELSKIVTLCQDFRICVFKDRHCNVK